MFLYSLGVISRGDYTMGYFAYCRESIDLKSGIEIQKERIKKYCEYSGKEISKWFIDNNQSAYKQRPQYDLMMKEIMQSDSQGIICTHLSRFGRSTDEVLQDYYRIVPTKELIFTEQTIDTGTTNGKLMLGMLAVFADFERDTIRERLESGKAYARMKGTKSGLPMHRPQLEINWKQVDDLLSKHISIPTIAKIIGVSKKTLYDRIKTRPSKP